MKRTNSMWRFAAGNRRLLLMMALVLIGCVSGVAVYASWHEQLPAGLHQLLVVTSVKADVSDVMAQFFASCFQPMCLWLLLFFSGLSACGAPASFLVPVFWGLGMGLLQAHYYAQGMVGMLLAFLLIVPHSLLKAIALSIGSVQALQLSLQLAGQLLPRGAHCGGLWQTFRLYCVRFLLLLPLLLAAAALDVGLRLCLFRFFN